MAEGKVGEVWNDVLDDSGKMGSRYLKMSS